MSKKTILKKACGGKGGPVWDAVKKGVGAVAIGAGAGAAAGMVGRVGQAVAKGLKKGKEITPANFPTTSPKNKALEIINPTNKDVTGFNERFNTIRKAQPLQGIRKEENLKENLKDILRKKRDERFARQMPGVRNRGL